MPRLIITEHGKKDERTCECEENTGIGRMEDNAVVLESNGVSRQHAKIVRAGENFFLVDLESGNGTMLNGAAIEPVEKHLLRNNDLISIDTYDLRFYMTDEAVKQSFNEEITDSDVLEVKLLKKVIRALDKETVPSIEVLNGSAEGKKIYFADDMNELTIGRDPSCDFSINEFVISRRHAKITKRWGGIVIRDIESKNGTFINNRRVVEEFLHDGDRIALGTIVFIFRNPQEINLASFSKAIPPKYTPAKTKPDEILIPKEEETEEPPEQPQSTPIEEEENPPFEIPREAQYPLNTPKAALFKQLTPVEIGMIGLGSLVLIFALITIANLIFE